MKVESCMKKNAISVKDTDDLAIAARQFVKHHVGMLPVVNGKWELVGVLQIRDLLTLVLPVFTRLIEDFDFVGTFGAANSAQPSKEEISKNVTEVMEEPVFVEESWGLTHAFALLLHHHLSDLPVVDAENRLVGVASRVDIGTALLKKWEIVSGD